MAFRLNDDLSSSASGGGDDELARLKQVLEGGTPAQQKTTLCRLIKLRAENVLVECLSSKNSAAVRLATEGLWECWLGERGQAARREMEKGIERMNSGDLAGAMRIFAKLTEKYPDWAEAQNKQATALYLLGNARLSLRICQAVVELKPHHFGAWNGMALCAAQLGRWRLALDAAQKGLSLLPTAQANRDLIQLAQSKLDEGE